MIRAPVTHPLLYQVNTRVWLYERGRARERPATLDDLTDAWVDTVASDGFRQAGGMAAVRRKRLQVATCSVRRRVGI